jgi:hypothetical protein
LGEEIASKFYPIERVQVLPYLSYYVRTPLKLSISFPILTCNLLREEEEQLKELKRTLMEAGGTQYLGFILSIGIKLN